METHPHEMMAHEVSEHILTSVHQYAKDRNPPGVKPAFRTRVPPKEQLMRFLRLQPKDWHEMMTGQLVDDQLEPIVDPETGQPTKGDRAIGLPATLKYYAKMMVLYNDKAEEWDLA